MYTKEVLSLLQIGNSQGTAMLLCSLPMKSRKIVSPGIFDTLSYVPTLFMMSLIQTARHKVAALVVMFL